MVALYYIVYTGAVRRGCWGGAGGGGGGGRWWRLDFSLGEHWAVTNNPPLWLVRWGEVRSADSNKTRSWPLILGACHKDNLVLDQDHLEAILYILFCLHFVAMWVTLLDQWGEMRNMEIKTRLYSEDKLPSFKWHNKAFVVRPCWCFWHLI